MNRLLFFIFIFLVYCLRIIFYGLFFIILQPKILFFLLYEEEDIDQSCKSFLFQDIQRSNIHSIQSLNKYETNKHTI